MDRVLTWYIDTLTGDDTEEGPVYIMDRDYDLTTAVVRVHAKHAPDAGVMRVDIMDDGTSIFTTRFPALQKGRDTLEEWDDFTDPTASNDADRIERFSLVSLKFLESSGAKGVTVSLELNAADGDGSYQGGN